jgi:hypothetical protein
MTLEKREVWMLRKSIVLSGCTLMLACSAAPASDDNRSTSSAVNGNSASHRRDNGHGRVDRVLLLSIDGFHASDLDRYVQSHTTSALAELVSRGVKYTNAISSRPSDSFPGTLAMVTGGSPATTGIFYDVSWDDNLSPPGSDCSRRGTVVTYNQLASFNSNDVNTTINPAKLPRDPDNGCVPVYPHSFLQVNTLYEVMHVNGLRTAACDKHATYELLNGPSGVGVDDLYTPEAEANGAKKSIKLTEQNDELKVGAILNQISGYDHTGTQQVGVPSIMGMNFQAVNIGQKISGYANGNGDLTTGLSGAFAYVDGAIARMLSALRSQGILDSTRIILTAKSGNSPIDPAARVAIDPLKYNAVINGVQPGLIGQITADTVALVWLTDHSRAADVAAAIQANAALLGAETVYTGADLDAAFGSAFASSPNRRPDVIVQPSHGVVYTTATKLADHGGFTDDDIHVPLVISQPGLTVGTIDAPVDLRQVAPTILKSLGLHPRDLDAVRIEGTKRLPNLDDDGTDDGDD